MLKRVEERLVQLRVFSEPSFTEATRGRQVVRQAQMIAVVGSICDQMYVLTKVSRER